MIRLLENFNITIIVMQYFGTSHKAFLTLSVLNKNIREKLNEFYEEFRRAMIEWSVEILIEGKGMHKLLLPADLFRFSINLNSEEDAYVFGEFVEKVTELKGYYFGKHFMHQQICIKDIHVDSEVIHILYPYAEKMKLIIVVNDHDRRNYFKNEGNRLFDKVVLGEDWIVSYCKQSLYFSNYTENDSDEIDLISETFKTISSLSLKKASFTKSISILKQLK